MVQFLDLPIIGRHNKFFCMYNVIENMCLCWADAEWTLMVFNTLVAMTPCISS